MGGLMSSNYDEVEQFAQRLIELVRDESIEACDMLSRGDISGRLGDRWRQAMTAENGRRSVTQLLPDVVDQVLFHLLDAIDNDRLPLLWRSQAGASIDLATAGRAEMAGRYVMGRGGWIERFSKQRYFDPLADLP